MLSRLRDLFGAPEEVACVESKKRVLILELGGTVKRIFMLFFWSSLIVIESESLAVSVPSNAPRHSPTIGFLRRETAIGNSDSAIVFPETCPCFSFVMNLSAINPTAKPTAKTRINGKIFKKERL